MEYVVVVTLGHRFTIIEPSQEILITLLDQGLISIEAFLVHALDMGIGKPTENEICLAATSITASVNQTLLAGGDRFRHHQILNKASIERVRTQAKHENRLHGCSERWAGFKERNGKIRR